jgi:hypothetical protein
MNSKTMPDPVISLDKALESIKAARAAIAQINIAEPVPDERRKHADWYPLLRRMVLAQINGDYEAGERFNHIMAEHGMPNNEAEFDALMELAAKAMGVRA